VKKDNKEQGGRGVCRFRSGPSPLKSREEGTLEGKRKKKKTRLPEKKDHSPSSMREERRSGSRWGGAVSCAAGGKSDPLRRSHIVRQKGRQKNTLRWDEKGFGVLRSGQGGG